MPTLKTEPELADAIPPLSNEEFERLKADIKENGQRDKICCAPDGSILDGHHRFKILGQKAEFRIIKIPREEWLAFAIRANLNRRNLSPEQKSELRKRQQEWADQRKADGWTQARIAKALGVARETVRDWFNTSNGGPANTSKTDSRQKITAKQEEEIIESVSTGQTQAQVASDYGISQQRVAQIVAKSNKKKAKRKQYEEKISNAKSGGAAGPFDLILADPPWRYDFAETDNRKIENQYNTMTVEQICEQQPNSAKDCILFLWATAPKLREALQVMDAWGFDYKSHAVWDKQKIGMGYWFRGQHELLLVGTKGKVEPPQQSKRVSSVFSEKRTTHSSKPECVFKWIERAFPDATKQERYQRKPRVGWFGEGNEV